LPGGPHAYYFSNLRVLPRKLDGVTILKGAEANIINYEGEIDLEEREYEGLDYLIASMHPPCVPYGDIEQNTQAVIKAMEHEKVRIIGHPDDGRYPLDYEKVVENAKIKNVFLEINDSSMRPTSFRVGALDNYRAMLKICKEKQAMVVFGSDAHFDQDIGNFSNCIKLIEELDFPEELVLNFRSKKEILEIFLGKEGE
jgi:putative hydrolase